MGNKTTQTTIQQTVSTNRNKTLDKTKETVKWANKTHLVGPVLSGSRAN